jgi:hypothetical protein
VDFFVLSHASRGQAIDPTEPVKRPPSKPAGHVSNPETFKRPAIPVKNVHNELQRFGDHKAFENETRSTAPMRGDRHGTVASNIRQRAAVSQRSGPTQQTRNMEKRRDTMENTNAVQVLAEEHEECPSKKLVRLSDVIKKLESEAKYEELVRAWVEYGACVRMEHSDTHPLLVRTHFSIATTYLRQKMVVQALQHFKAAEEINSCNDYDTDKEAATFRCR